MNNRTDWDKELLKAFEQQDFQYNPQNWEKLKMQLPKNSKNKNLLSLWTQVAASVAAVCLIAWAVSLYFNIKEQEQIFAQENNNPKQSELTTTTQSENNLKTSANNSKVATHKEQQVAKVENSSIPRDKINQDQTIVNNKKNGRTNILHLNEQSDKTPSILPTDDLKLTLCNPEVSQPHSTIDINLREIYHYAEEIGNQDFTLKKQIKSYLGISGGMNYGTTNAGYSMAIAAKTHISKHIFIDGSFGLALNNGVSNVVQAPLHEDFQSRPASANQMPVKSPEIQPMKQLHYMQFNPAIGYQLDEHFSFSMGGDFQRLMRDDNNQTIQLYADANGSASIYPKIDIGATIKTEVSVTPYINAGIIYREGLNNLIYNNQNINYINRRYIQIQFKYQLPIY